ncbi:polyamine transporter 2 [Colletotrichum navitas]|uniref:Polyamine transporter 2 n=1 Tax=Colletotrichum navitas TaxID=681940 RepID=A0AAD8V4N2_9PEZI|nr:polyamine transporter 2 [Colletotrichum navitas]KAK1594137.1 polyamine transporter 2 [Colletotrichum navitas]
MISYFMTNPEKKETRTWMIRCLKNRKSRPVDTEINAGTVTVCWNGPKDGARPRNWSPVRKWAIVITNSLATFMVSFSSSVFSGFIIQVQAELEMSADVSLLGISLYVLGFSVGPMVWGPASELYGKTRPLWAGYVFFCIFQAVSAVSRSAPSLLISRLLQAIAGSSTLAIMSGMFVDFLTEPTSRGIATAIFSLAVFCGPAAGPIVGNVVTAHLGWRWAIWITLISSVGVGISAFLITPETSETIILRRMAQRLRKETGNEAISAPGQEYEYSLSVFADKYLTKPLRMFGSEPILVMVTIYMSFVYGIIYLTFELYPQAFVVARGWSLVDASLAFLGILAGVIVACIALGAHSICHVGPRFAETGEHVPERRLPPMMLGSVILPIGTFWFSWTSFPEVSAVAQICSGVLIGAGAILSFMSGVLYLTEVYLQHANSALAINNFIRSLFAAGFPYLGKLLIVRLGISVGGSILGGICFALMPVSVVLWKFGNIIRQWSKYAYQE